MRFLSVVLVLGFLLTVAPTAVAERVTGDVFLPPLTACTWSGSYKPVAHAAGVTVWAYSCDPET